MTTKLHWINGPLINGKLADKSGRLRRLLRAGASNDEIIGEFYWSALSRPPTVEESAYWKRQLDAADRGGQRIELLEDFVWSLLSCREFVTNH